MPEENNNQPIPDGIEVSENVMKTGSISFMTKAAFTNKPPEKMARLIKAFLYFFGLLNGAVGASDLFSGKQAKVIMFFIFIATSFCGAAEIAFGVKSENEK